MPERAALRVCESVCVCVECLFVCFCLACVSRARVLVRVYCACVRVCESDKEREALDKSTKIQCKLMTIRFVIASLVAVASYLFMR